VFERAASNDSLVDSYAQLILESTTAPTTRASTKTPTTIHIDSFRKYCSTHIIISSWLRALASFPSSIQLDGGGGGINLLYLSSSCESHVASSSDSVANTRKQHPVARDLKADRALSHADHQAFLLSRSAAAATELLANTNNEAAGGETPAEGDIGLPDEAPFLPAEKVKVPVDTSKWRRKVDLEAPVEEPALRPDVPEDLFQLSWVCGLNAAAATCGGVKRCVHYHGPLDSAGIVYSAANHVVHMKKRTLGGGEGTEEGGEQDADRPWQQAVYTEHTAAITSMQRMQSRRGEAANLLVTADSDGTVVLWHMDSPPGMRVAGRFSTPCTGGVRLLDISSDGQLIVAVLQDTANTVCIYSAPSSNRRAASSLVFSRELSGGQQQVGGRPGLQVLDVQFAHTSAMFCVATSGGVRFFVDEGGGCMGEGGMRMYEERGALYAHVGRRALGVAATALSKFECADQMLCGTESGQLAVWHGRSCFQLLEDVHASAITALDFNDTTGTLVAADCAGHIRCVYAFVCMYMLVNA
jgi:hypothetical protein